ncbi:hypothetical protein Cci01nite_83190 [Catellatospora citrea]|uniref:Uncharacterized protein n=1 Tax=Catellatospora citrea TaxID=53366 RepID=A0A8J3P417_9ACTN|nr:hypothetical protein C8E86_7956 [Catellatospora citrea]GIG03226.1 hypothetical protein Cci01nite_83190 [Catellatospora citrea]
MDWTIVIVVIALPVVALAAWGMWLVFAAHVARSHGLPGLRALRYVADGFRPREWALLIPRRVISTAASWQSAAETAPPEEAGAEAARSAEGPGNTP